MRKIIFNLLLIGGIVSAVMFSSCNDDEPTPGHTDYSQDKGNFNDERDGKEYKWVKIGDQIWMAENLAFKIDTGGCWAYDNNKNYVSTYGYLYNWWTAKAAAPSGWHLPSDDEWTHLEDYLIENGYSYDGVIGNKGIAKSLAMDNGWTIYTKQGTVGNTDFPGYRNKTGFSALPGGQRLSIGPFNGVGNYGYWWSATKYDIGRPYYRFLSYSRSVVSRYYGGKYNGFSVRCVKD